MAIEMEYKYALDADTYEKIRNSFSDFRSIRMETAYYDTPDHQLSRQKCTLRLRLENEACICTLKTPLPDGSRRELECSADTIQEGMARLGLSIGPVSRVCGARFTRLASDIRTDAVVIELALDKGVLLGADRELPLLEAELEYKSGSQEAFHAYAQEFAARFGLTIEPKSKFARARALAEL